MIRNLFLTLLISQLVIWPLGAQRSNTEEDFQAIKDLDCKAGVALNPHTPVALLSDILADLDLVCLMSVNPGFGGQSFINGTFEKIRQLKSLSRQLQVDPLIEIDGGVKQHLAADLIAAGADVLVAGSFVFGSDEPIETIKNLKQVTA